MSFMVAVAEEEYLQEQPIMIRLFEAL